MATASKKPETVEALIAKLEGGSTRANLARMLRCIEMMATSAERTDEASLQMNRDSANALALFADGYYQTTLRANQPK